MEKIQIENIDKNDAFDILDRTIGFINNCDTKTSIVLGIYGIIVAVLFTNEGLLKLKTIIIASMGKGMVYGILYVIPLMFVVGIFIFGICKLFYVLFPKIDCKDLKQEDLDLDSKLYFGDIAKNSSYKQYKEKLLNCDDDEYINDIISQIYLNSFICNKKFMNYKKGFKVSFIGLILFIIMFGIGVLIY